MASLPKKQAAQLRSLVGLKRQKAEQDMLVIQKDVRRIETEIEAVQASMIALDQPGTDYDAASLARRHGGAERLVAELARKRAELSARQADLEAARDALKRVMHSEDRIGDL